MIVFVIVFLIGAFGMNFPIFSSTMAVEFGRGAGEYGLLSSILAIGSLTGALLAARRERARIRVIILATAFFGVATLIAALMPTFWTFAASTILIGLGAVTILTTANGYVQTTTEPALRGRVMALYMAILVGGTPIGAPIVGAVADSLGPRWALGVAAVAAAVAALIGVGWLVFSRGMRLARHPRVRLATRRAIRGCPDRGALRHRDAVRFRWCGPPRADPRDERLVPADFSEEVALTSPIPLLRRSIATARRRDTMSRSAPTWPHRAPLGAPHGVRAARCRADGGAGDALTRAVPSAPGRGAHDQLGLEHHPARRSNSSPRSASFRSRSTAV